MKMMRIPSISSDLAIKVWNDRKNEMPIELSGESFDYQGPNGGERLTDLELGDLQDKLEEVMIRYGDSVSKANAGKIDAEIVEPVHRALRELATPYQLSDLGFWRWLSNVACDGFFWKFIMWRLSSSQQVNWGMTSPAQLIEVYFYRAWLRGHKMLDDALPDPYLYAKKGSSDFWRSHILRQDFGRDREFVKAFIDTVYDGQGKTIVGTAELRTKLIPALRAWTSSGSFSHLTYSENLEIIGKLKEEEI